MSVSRDRWPLKRRLRAKTSWSAVKRSNGTGVSPSQRQVRESERFRIDLLLTRKRRWCLCPVCEWIILNVLPNPCPPGATARPCLQARGWHRFYPKRSAPRPRAILSIKPRSIPLPSRKVKLFFEKTIRTFVFFLFCKGNHHQRGFSWFHLQAISTQEYRRSCSSSGEDPC